MAQMKKTHQNKRDKKNIIDNIVTPGTVVSYHLNKEIDVAIVIGVKNVVKHDDNNTVLRYMVLINCTRYNILENWFIGWKSVGNSKLDEGLKQLSDTQESFVCDEFNIITRALSLNK